MPPQPKQSRGRAGTVLDMLLLNHAIETETDGILSHSFEPIISSETKENVKREKQRIQEITQKFDVLLKPF
jgi:hypothetical protein